MNKDAGQKDMLCRHFYTLGWFAQPEVIVFHKGGVNEQKKVITDIDVLALRPGTNLRWEIVLGDCKTLRGQSPANRALWLRGLMSFFNASEGILVLKKEQPMEIDHKLFASGFGVTLLSEDEFNTYDKAILYPSGSSDSSINLSEIQAIMAISNRFPRIKTLSEYLYALSWNEDNFVELVRKLLGEAQQVSQEIDPLAKDHQALVLDACAIFSIGLAECIGIIFKQYLKPGTQSQLDESLKYLLWGGRSQYDFVAKLRNELIIAKKATPTPLTLPEWDRFLQLVRNLLEYPALAFSLPILFRSAAVDILHNRPFLDRYNSEEDLLLVKFGMLVYNYFCRASKFPPQAREIIENEFVKKQTSVLSNKRNGPDRESVSIENSPSQGQNQAALLVNQKSDEITRITEETRDIQPELPLDKDKGSASVTNNAE